MNAYDHMMHTQNNTKLGSKMETIQRKVHIEVDARLFQMLPKVIS